ncbi:MAG: anthranilate synthase component I family protein [Planctomycetota bacterium]
MNPPFDIAADLDTPVSAFLKLRPLEPRFLLESVERGEHLGRYSFIGFGEALDLRLDRTGVHLAGESRARPDNRDQLLRLWREALERSPRPAAEGVVPPLRGGLVGVAAYDLVRHFERLPSRPLAPNGPPEALYVAPRSLLAFDHLTRRVALLHDGAEDERRALRAEVIRALHGPLPNGAARMQHEPPRPSFTAAAFQKAVRHAQEHIARGDVYQLVLSIRFEGRCDVVPFEVYRALRLLNPSPYMYYCDFGGLTVIGSSPEALVKLAGRSVSLRPIAGTRPRGQDSIEDSALEHDLLADPKETAEHVMLVDLARNDLGRVATPGSVTVDPYMTIERYSHVMHIVSGVNGTLAPGKDAFDLFAATFPAGTVVGAPKVRAMELIDELEPVPRGLYAGTVGYFGHGGTMDQAIAIRTLVFHEDHYSYQAGAGIVADSVPAREHAEVMAKSAALEGALHLAEEGL